MRTPLAWQNLTSSWSKCALASAGVGFAVVLMFMQIGFRNALIDNNAQLFSLFNAAHVDIIVVSRARYNISTEQRFPRKLLEQAAAIEGIESYGSACLERGTASVKVEGTAARPIRVIGIKLQAEWFSDQQLFEKIAAIDRHNAALVDRRSKAFYGFAPGMDALREQAIELNGKSLPVYGEFDLGTDFANDGNLLMSERLLAEYFPWRTGTASPLDVVDIGLLRAREGSDPRQLAEKIRQLAPDQIDARPMSDFIQREKDFWARSTPIGKIFFIGTLMGLVVGTIICYQIQFTDISEHMAEFATLKAMGYGPKYFWSVILCQSIYLASFGFAPGLLVALGLYAVLAEFSGLIMEMTLGRILLVWSLTLIMCVISGILAIRKLFGSDPASLF